MPTMDQMQEFTATMLAPILQGSYLEQEPRCEVAQYAVASPSLVDVRRGAGVSVQRSDHSNG